PTHLVTDRPKGQKKVEVWLRLNRGKELDHGNYLLCISYRKPDRRSYSNVFGDSCSRKAIVGSHVRNPDWLTRFDNPPGKACAHRQSSLCSGGFEKVELHTLCRKPNIGWIQKRRLVFG